VSLPEKFEIEMLEDEKMLTDLHLMLIKRQITDGALICEACDRVYPIANGIPNMLLNEQEV
jgi:multifunctional methyltransferase subunit TRM112